MFAPCIKRATAFAPIQLCARVHCTPFISIALLHSVAPKRIRFANALATADCSGKE
jgi:hypothetical protein